MLKAFVDDSGSGGDSPWVVLAGYVSTVQDWLAFEQDWVCALDTDPRIEYFKHAEAESLKGQFLGFTREARDAKIDALIKVIQNHVMLSIAARMRISDYNDVFRGWVPRDLDDPYYFLFTGIVLAAAGIERMYGHASPIEFVFDSSEVYENPSMVFFRHMKHRYDHVSGANVAYRDDKKFVPLQAADLLAWEVRRNFCSTEPRRRHYDAARQTLEPPFCHIVTKELLIGMRGAIEAKRIAVAEATGTPPIDIRKLKWR
ncbi:MAG: DUF3800 domain-containing protein [Bdellovibrionales bacterium]|nr:DUF3800 domain-containing protein [Bdellovibrionales bacterium]